MKTAWMAWSAGLLAAWSVAARGAPTYAVVASQDTLGRPEWKAAADALVRRYQATILTVTGNVAEARAALAAALPRYTVFLARPEEVDVAYIRDVHQLTRALDDDPYTDTEWGVITGRTGADAERIATATAPRVVRTLLAQTGIGPDRYEESFVISDGRAGEWKHYKSGREESGNDGDTDRTELFLQWFVRLKPDAVITSSHGSQRNIEMPFSRGNIIARDGRLFGQVGGPYRTQKLLPVEPDSTPRVFFPVGNCLVGDVNRSPDSMLVTWLSAYGANQAVAYTLETWFGEGGWGTLRQWEQNPGRLGLADCFFLNHQNLLCKLERQEGNLRGLMYDRDCVAFYGNPAFAIPLVATAHHPKLATKLEESDGVFTYTIRLSQKGGKDGEPVGELFPDYRLGGIEIVAGSEFDPVIADNFILVRKVDFTDTDTIRVKFRAKKL